MLCQPTEIVASHVCARGMNQHGVGPSTSGTPDSAKGRLEQPAMATATRIETTPRTTREKTGEGGKGDSDNRWPQVQPSKPRLQANAGAPSTSAVPKEIQLRPEADVRPTTPLVRDVGKLVWSRACTRDCTTCPSVGFWARQRPSSAEDESACRLQRSETRRHRTPTGSMEVAMHVTVVGLSQNSSECPLQRAPSWATSLTFFEAPTQCGASAAQLAGAPPQ